MTPMTDVQRGMMRRRCCGLVLAALLVCGPATLARAEVHVDGSPAAVRITTDRAAISDVLAAIAKGSNVTYRTAIPLDAAAAATYAGTMGQVISHLLAGYNYVIRKDGEATEIVVYGRDGKVAIPLGAPAASFRSRWR